MRQELKPCPFCGSEAQDTGAVVASIHITCVRCSNMDCLASFKSVDAEVWNRRAPAEPEPIHASAETIEQVRDALRLAMDICDAVPNRAHQLPEGEPLRHLGMLVNYQEETGAHGYAVIRDAKAAFEQAVTTLPKGAARSWNGTMYHNIEEIYHRFEDGEALHMWLDDQKVPRADADRKVFSLVGRVARLSKPTAQGTAQSIDTDDFRELMCNLGYWAEEDEGDRDHSAKSLIEFINRHIAAQAPADRDAWQPIETAPKDGSEVLLYLPAPYDRIAKARWFDLWQNWIEGDFPDAQDEYGGIGALLPTHWMPLPSQPAASHGAEKGGA